MEIKAYKDGTKCQIKLLKQTGIIIGFHVRRNILQTYDVAYNQNGAEVCVEMSPSELEVDKNADKVVVIGYKASE